MPADVSGRSIPFLFLARGVAICYLRYLTMVWCSCPVRCKGGRDVSQATYNRHKRETDEQQRRQLVAEIRHTLPGGIPPPPDVLENTRRRHDREEILIAPRKKARRGNGHRGNTEMGIVSVFVNFSDSDEVDINQDNEMRSTNMLGGDGQGWIVGI